MGTKNAEDTENIKNIYENIETNNYCSTMNEGDIFNFIDISLFGNKQAAQMCQTSREKRAA